MYYLCMKRRLFLSLPIFVSTFVSFACAKNEDPWSVIESVQRQLLPKHPKFPSADEIGALRYLKMVSYHDSFDPADLELLKQGAKELQSRGYHTSLSAQEKEQHLQKYAQQREGERWVSLLLNYTLEALFSDPIYGGNRAQIGWKSYQHHAGKPRPKKPFGALS